MNPEGKLIMEIIVMLLILLLYLYRVLGRPVVCDKKITKHINDMGGEIKKIEQMHIGEDIYIVYYSINGEKHHCVVKFDLFYKAEWNLL